MFQKIEFENHYSVRVLEIIFPEGYTVSAEQDIVHLKMEWTKNLKSWHFPYTCLFDVRKFIVSNEMKESFARMLKFFSNFFMKKIVGFAENEQNFSNLGFSVVIGYENAVQEVGLGKTIGLKRDLTNLRSCIQIDNDFNGHVIEIQFLSEVEFKTKEDVFILGDKIKNILRQWHTPYSILVNCINCVFTPEASKEFLAVEKFLRSFFCQNIIGYSPKISKEEYPFKTYRSRHLAAAELRNSELQSGSVANCSTRKS